MAVIKLCRAGVALVFSLSVTAGVFSLDFTTLIVHMVKKKTRQQNGSGSAFHLPEVNPYDSKRESEAAWLWDEIKKGGFSPDRLALMGEDGSMVITMFLMAFKVISNPTHSDNNWRSIVETMSIGKDIYYRLATEIPIPVMDYWQKHGHPPACRWEFFDPKASTLRKASVKNTLKKALPATSAKKAKKVLLKTPAKKHEPADLTPDQLAEMAWEIENAKYESDPS